MGLESLAPAEPYVTSFEATVERAGDGEVRHRLADPGALAAGERVAFNAATEEGVGGDAVRVVTIHGPGSDLDPEPRPAARRTAGRSRGTWRPAAAPTSGTRARSVR